MAVYQVNYDLNTPGKDYSALYDAIKSYKYHNHALDSCWFICVDGTKCSEVRDNLKKYTDSNDNILVTKFKGGWATTFSGETVDFLREHL